MSKTQSVKQQTAQKQALAKKIQNYVTETYEHDYFISLQNGYIYLYAGDNFITSAVINAISDKYSLDFIGVSIARLNTSTQATLKETYPALDIDNIKVEAMFMLKEVSA